MKITAQERKILNALAKLIDLALNTKADKSGVTFAKYKPATEKKRFRRTSNDAAALKKKVLQARKKNVPVTEIAKTNKVTTAYVYQLLSKN